MQVEGRIVAVGRDRARVECTMARPPACPACAAGRGCSWRLDSPRHLDVDAPPGGTGLYVGDAVELEVADRELLAAALRTYLPPAAGLVAGPAIWQWLAGPATSDGPLALAALLGLACGAAVSRRLTRLYRLPIAVRRAGGG